MRARLLGSWELVAHGLRAPDGKFKPTSDFLLGRLIYEPGGAMSVLIALKNPLESLSDLIAYSGRFSIKDGSVIHHVEAASRSARVGNSEERLVRFENDDLVLTTRPAAEGMYEITWRKVVNS